MIARVKTAMKYPTGKAALFGIVVGITVMFLIPEGIPKDEYKKEIEMMAVTYVITNSVCPNKIGVLSLRDSYTNLIDKISKRTWVQRNFEGIFTAKCTETMQQVAANSTITVQ
ncbi:hypothetical protein KNT87_gp098 [Erwinia phage Cronus]|uniref:Uncharacterized protein n=1 Tax=Erwinia phage Cronus TaxID=2163633 RepID=A0A2S1GMC3_9CAUD|nr:hypothetical protein KNT87_gp098 [Erwinia phage Cronus]AWD90537.1 hypothetical protein [Erwinia phage Cronus]